MSLYSPFEFAQPPRPRTFGLRAPQLLLCLAAFAVLALGLSIGIAGPFLWGHDGYAGSLLMGTARGWMHTPSALFPILGGMNEVPLRLENAYVHHPVLAYRLNWLAALALGPTPLAARLVSALSTAAAGLALVGIALRVFGDDTEGERERGAWVAVAALWAWVLLPSVQAFGALDAHDNPQIALSLLGLWAYLAGNGFTAVFLTGLALNTAWPAYYLGAAIGVHALYTRRLGVAVGLLLAATVSFGGHVWLVKDVGLWDDLWGSAKFRQGGDIEWGAFGARMLRWVWKNFGYALPVLSLGGLAWSASLRRPFVPLALLTYGVAHLVVFKQAAWVHIYLQHSLAPFIALCGGAAVVAIGYRLPLHALGGAARLAGRSAVALVAALVTLGTTVPITYESRSNSATIDERGYDARAQEYAAARALSRLVPEGTRIGIVPPLKVRLEFEWNVQRPIARLRSPAAALSESAQEVTPWMFAETERTDPGVLRALDSRAIGYDFGRYRAWELGERLGEGSAATIDCSLRKAKVGALERWLKYPVQPKLEAACEEAR